MLIQCNFHMDTQTTQTQTQTQTQTTQTQTQTTQTTQTQTQTTQTTQTTQYIDWRDDEEDDFDLIGFGIASNGGRLSITPHK